MLTSWWIAIKLTLKFIWKIPRLISIGVVKLYQKTLSPDHGPMKEKFPNGYCKFYPTCSQYCIEALKKHGLVVGGIMSIIRIVKCNPFSKGGHDPVK